VANSLFIDCSSDEKTFALGYNLWFQ